VERDSDEYLIRMTLPIGTQNFGAGEEGAWGRLEE